MNSGTLRGIPGKRLTRDGDADKVLAGDGDWVDNSRLIASTTFPASTVGAVGDCAVVVSDATNTPAAALLPPKSTTGWAANTASAVWGPDSEYVPLPYRHKSQGSSPLLPGWTTNFATSWMTGTNPTDIHRSAAFGGAFYSTGSGTKVYIGRSKTSTSAMPFFSMELEVTTLPEATRFAWGGQLGYDGAAYGYAARVDSAGAVTLYLMDGVYGDSRLGTGTFTISAGDTIIMERFGYRISLYRRATGTRDLVSGFHSNVRNAATSGFDGFGYVYGTQSYGYMTDSTSVRVGRLEFSG